MKASLITVKSIKTKSIIIIVFTVALCTAISLGSAIWQNSTRVRNEIKNTISLNTKLLANGLVNPLEFDSNSNATDLLKEVSKINDFLYCRIYNEKNELFAEYGDKSHALKSIPINKDSIFTDGDVFHSYAPVKHNNITLGTLYIINSNKKYTEQAHQSIIIFILFFTGTIIFSILISSRIHRIITKPLIRLNEKVYDIAQSGDFSIRVQPKQKDEIGELYSGINLFLEQIQKRDEENKFVVEELMKSERLLRLAFENSPVCYSINDIQDDQIIEFNHGFTELTGYSEQDLNKSMFSYQLWDDTNNYRNVIREVSDKGSVSNIEVKLKRKNGDSIIALLSASNFVSGNRNEMFCAFNDISHLKAIQEQLIESEEKHRIISELNSDYVYSAYFKDNKLKVDWVSGSFESITGYTFEEINNKEGTLHSIIHADDIERIIESFNNIHDIDHRTIEYRIITKDCRIKCIRDKNIILLDEKTGQLSRVYGSVQDITISKKHEQALIESESKYRNIVETANEGIWMIDYNSNTIYVNDKITNMLGFTKDELMGNSFYDYIDEEQFEKEHPFNTGIQKSDDQMEFMFRKKDGSFLWTLLNISPVFDSEHNYSGALAMITDMSKKKEAEKALKISEEKYRKIVETSAEGIFIIDKNHKIEYLNKRLADMLEYTPEEMIGINPMDLIAPEDRSFIPKKIEERKQGVVDQYEINYLTKSGKKISVLVNASPMFNDQSAYIGSLGMVSNISDMKKTEKALRESEERYRLLFSNMTESFAHIKVIFNDKGNAVDWKYLELNNSFEAQTGVSKLAVGKNVSEVLPEALNDSVDWLKIFERVSTTGKREDIEFCSAFQNRWFLINVFSPNKGEIALTGIEITERKTAELALKESEERFRRITENARDMIYRMSLPDGHYEYISPAAKDIFGYSPDDFYENPVLIKEVIHPDWHDYFKAQWQKLLTGKMPKTYEYQIITKNKKIKWLHQRNVLVRDENGKIIAIEGIVTDITERKKAEIEMQQATDIFNNIQTGMYIYKLENPNDDRTLRMVAANPATVTLTGVPVESIIGKTLDENFSGLREKDIPFRYAEVIRTGIPYSNEDIFYSDNNVIEGAFSVKTFPLPDNRIAVAFENITEKKIYEKALKDSEEKYKLLYENSGTLNVLFNPDKSVVLHNSNFANMFGDYIRFFDNKDQKQVPDFIKKFLAPLDDCLKKRKVVSTSEKISFSKNNTIWLESLYIPVIDTERRIIGVQVIAKDITMQKQAELELLKQNDEMQSLNEEYMAQNEELTESIMRIQVINQQLHEAQKKISESEKRFKSIIEYGPDSIFISDKNNKIVDCNNLACENLGYSKDEILQMSLKDIIPKKSSSVNIYNKKHKIPNDTPYEFESLHIRKDGTIIPVEIKASLITLNNNQLTISFVRDITERKKAEKALLESEATMNALLNATTESAILIDIPGNVLTLNDVASIRFNTPPEKIIGSNIYELVPDHIISQRKEMVLQTIKSGRTIRYQEEQEGKFYDNNLYPVTDTFNNVTAIAIYSKDITAQKMAEYELKKQNQEYQTLNKEYLTQNEELIESLDKIKKINLELERAKEEAIESEARFRILIEQGPDAVFVTDEKGDIVDVNKITCRILGYKKEEIVGNPIIKFDSKLNTIPDFDNLLKNIPNNPIVFESSLICKDGTYIPIEVTATIIKYKNKTLVIAFARDITERKKSREELQKSESLLNETQEIAKMGGWTYNVRDKDLFLTKSTYKILGIQPDSNIDVLKKGFSKKDFIKIQHSIYALNNSETMDLEVSYTTSRKTKIWIRLTAKVQILNGELLRITGNILDITAQKTAEESLRTTEMNLIKAQKMAHIGNWQISVDGNIFSWSDEVANIFGFTDSEPENMQSFIDKVYKDDIELINDALESVLKGKSQDFEHRIVVNNTIHWVREIAEIEFNDDGSPKNIIGLTYDITERKIAEEEIKNNQKFLQSIIENLPIGMLIFDNFGHVIEKNKAIFQLLNPLNKKSVTEQIDNSIEDVLSETGLKKFTDDAKGGKNITGVIEKFSFHPPNNNTWLSISSFQVKDMYDKITANILLLQNITTRKMAEEELVKSEARFSEAFNLSPDLMGIIRESDGTIIDVNQGFLTVLGYNKHEVIGKSWHDINLWAPNQFKPFEIKYTINGYCRIESKFQTKNKRHIDCDLSAARIVLDGINHIIFITKDISEQKIAQQQLQKHHEKLLDLNRQISDYKIMALRSIMNPHFIFNSLNSIQYFIGKNEKKMAINYLSLFSKLIRNVLNSSIHQKITLETELEILNYYIELERIRFDNKFEFILSVDENLETEYIEVPSLILQPYVENAIIHGLTNKDGSGLLKVELSQKDNFLLCFIEDDGIGRKEAIRIKEKRSKMHQSVGMSVTQQRLEIINQTNNVAVNIIDLEDRQGNPTGTKVEIFLEI